MAQLIALVKCFYGSLDIKRLKQCYGLEGSGDDPGGELLNSGVLFDHESILQLFNEALSDTTGWAENDKTGDQFDVR